MVITEILNKELKGLLIFTLSTPIFTPTVPVLV